MEHTHVIVLRTRIIRVVGSALTLLSVSAAWLEAQTPAREQPRAWLVGLSIGAPGDGTTLHPELFTIGAHATSFDSGRLGGDFAVGTMPRLLFEGVLPLGARAGLALPLAPSEHLLLVPSAGGGLIAALGRGGFVAEPGLNVGAAASMLNGASSGIRAGITWHWFRGSRKPMWLLELGLVGRRGGS